MKIKITPITTFLLIIPLSITIMSLTNPHPDSPKTPDKKIQGIISKMSLLQKAQLIVGTGMYLELPDTVLAKMPLGLDGRLDPTDSAYSGMVRKIRKYLPGAAGTSAEFPKLGITAQVLTDGPAGMRIKSTRKDDTRTFYCTGFPIATLLASTWDPELVQSVGKALGNEVKEYGSDILLAPALNIQRDPLCGRNFEYYSEDPLLTGKMAAAMVKGVQSNGVGTAIKHFAANNSETNRLSVNTIVSERALREIYLKGFEIAIKEGRPWTVMSSYNRINGVYASENHDLLTKILRDDWGFQGYVMTDWCAGSDLVAQMKAGNDMIQPGYPEQIHELVAAVKGGKLDEKILDLNIARILQVMMETPRYHKYRYSSNPDLKAHAAVTRLAAAQGMVLLKNSEHTLPLDNNVKNIASFGNTSYDFIAGGTGSGDVNRAYTVSLIEGFRNGGFISNPELRGVYQAYMKEVQKHAGPSKNPLAFLGGKEILPEMPVSPALAADAAETSDIALVTIGRISGESFDRTAMEGDFYLSGKERNLIKNVADAFHAKGKKVVVVLNIGGVIETASWRDLPDAILITWLPGQEAGNSVVDVLSGKVNPSGKLVTTFPFLYQTAPTIRNFPGVPVKSGLGVKTQKPGGYTFNDSEPWEITYEEDIYVGYRYYHTFKVPVAYEFGYGLSYTGFTFSNLALSSNDFNGQVSFTVDVKNTGTVAGREVAQIYLHPPKGKLNKPEEILVAFAKTKLLEPGESQTLTFKLETRDLASFEEATSSWIAEPGVYTLRVGASSKDIRQSANFTVSGELSAGKVSKALVPTREIKKLKSNF